MEKKLDLEDTVRAVTEQPWARIRAFMKPVIPALAAVLIAALAAGCTMMDSVPQETPASEVEPPEALIAARVEDAEPAGEQLKTPVEQAGASVLSDSEQAAFCAYLLDKFDELEGARRIRRRIALDRRAAERYGGMPEHLSPRRTG